MSKEKNLTFEHYRGTVVSFVDNAYPYIETGRPTCVGVVCGPAIDRLYEFEKLGMEPEEIEDMITRQAKIMSDKLYAESENELLAKVNRDLTDSHLKLIGKNESQAATIRGLTEENDELRQQIKFLEETIEKFGVEELKKDLDLAIKKNRNLVQANSTLFVKKADLESEVYELKEEIAERERNIERLHEVIKNQNELIDELKGNSIPGMTCKQVISQQRERIQELDRICGVQKDEIEFLTRREHILEGSVRQLNECINERDKEIKDLEKIVKNQSIEISDLKGKLESKPLTLEEFEDWLRKLGEKYELTVFNSDNGNIHKFLFIDGTLFHDHVYNPVTSELSPWNDKAIKWEIYISLDQFEGAKKEDLKKLENQLRKELKMEPLEDDRA